MSTQTKLLSAATVLSALGDNDKIVVTTEAGQTGLVSKGTLKSGIALGKPSATFNHYGTSAKWIRVGRINNYAGFLSIVGGWNDGRGGSQIVAITSILGLGAFAKTILSANSTTVSKGRLVTDPNGNNRIWFIELYHYRLGSTMLSLRFFPDLDGAEIYQSAIEVDDTPVGEAVEFNLNVVGVETT